jgi:hypothetical protein
MVTSAPKVVNPNQKNVGDDIFDGLNLNQLIDDVNTILGVLAGGTLIGTRNSVNFIAGTDIQIDIADNPGSGRVDITITSLADGGGGGSTSTWTVKRFTDADATGVAWGDCIIMTITSGTDRTVPLPTVSGNGGKRIMVYRKGTGDGVVIIDGNGTQKVEEDDDYILVGNPSRVVLFADDDTGTSNDVVRVESQS